MGRRRNSVDDIFRSSLKVLLWNLHGISRVRFHKRHTGRLDGILFTPLLRLLKLFGRLNNAVLTGSFDHGNVS